MKRTWPAWLAVVIGTLVVFVALRDTAIKRFGSGGFR